MGQFLACGNRENPVRPTKAAPTEPENPPPPPPPPQTSGSQGCVGTSDVRLSLDEISAKVLRGEYGSDLQAILSDEVSRCVSKMIEEGVVSVSVSGKRIDIDVPSDGSRQVMFDGGYVLDEILDGQFGDQARNTVHLFARQFIGTEKRLN